jgi:endogenous inhibitor of DNA gyrase (YacG/DUF329 family)
MEYITGVITLQAIFSLYWEGYLAWFKGTIRPAVHENVQRILMCRTPQLGFHAFKCPTCGNIKLMPHSCKSRFCSSCGKVATDKWVEERLTDILDALVSSSSVHSSMAAKINLPFKQRNNVGSSIQSSQ